MRYRVFVGKVELSGVFEDEMLALFPLWVLVFQINSESSDMFDPCRDRTTVSAGMLRSPPTLRCGLLIPAGFWKESHSKSFRFRASCRLKCFNTLLASLCLLAYDLSSFPPFL